MSPRLTRVLGVVRQVGLTVGAVIGAACIVLTVAAVALDLRPLVFRSGSMAPTIDTGALAIAHRVDASALRVGQVVSVPTPSGERVTHRITSVEHAGDKAVLQLRGDANRTPDATPYVVTHADEVLVHVPQLGYAVGWLTGPVGLFVLGLYAAVLLSVVVRPGSRDGSPRPPRTPRSPRTPRRSRRPRPGRHRAVPVSTLALLVAAGLVSGTVLQARTSPTLAAFTDAGKVSGTTLRAYTVPTPATNDCQVTSGSGSSATVVMTWTASPTPALTYATTVSELVGYSAVVTASGSTWRLTVSYDPQLQPNRSQDVVVTATPSVTAAPSWTGGTGTWRFRTNKNKNFPPACGESTPPTVQGVSPDATTRPLAVERQAINTACGQSSVILCGQMSDASGITAVDYVLRRVSGGQTQCWSGSAWTTTCGGYQPATLVSQTQFNVSGNVATVYNAPGDYTLQVRATDEWDNAQVVTVSFTLTP